jgi:hypothetical protein
MLEVPAMSPRWIALACSIVSVACAPAELSGADRVEGGVVDSGGLLDAWLEGDATSDGDAPSIGDEGADTNEPDVRDAEAEDAAEGCPPVTSASDFYVVPSGDAGVCNTFSTISAALQAARASSAAQRTVHLAPGTYSDAAEFPIDLRGAFRRRATARDRAS